MYGLCLFEFESNGFCVFLIMYMSIAKWFVTTFTTKRFIALFTVEW